MKYNLKINNVSMPEPVADGVSISYKSLKSSNWGETYNGTTIGTVIGIKRTISITFGKLNETQMNLIRSNIYKNDFVSVSYINEAGTPITENFNFSDTDFKIKKYVNGHVRTTGIQITGEAENCI